MLVSAPLQSYDRASIHRPQYHSSRPYHTPTEKGTAGTMTLSSSHPIWRTSPTVVRQWAPAATTATRNIVIRILRVASASLPSANLAQSVPTRPKNHVRGVASDSRVWTTGRGFFEGRYRERQSYVSAQEQKDLEAERDAILQIQNVQAAKRRAKMMRLTPAFQRLEIAPTRPALLPAKPRQRAPPATMSPPLPTAAFPSQAPKPASVSLLLRTWLPSTQARERPWLSRPTAPVPRSSVASASICSACHRQLATDHPSPRPHPQIRSCSAKSPESQSSRR